MERNIEIKTNWIPRHIIYGFELNKKERAEFDYYGDDEVVNQSFFRYKGQVYDIGEFMRVPPTLPDPMQVWDGYSSDSYFSGVVVKYDDDLESIIVGSYFVWLSRPAKAGLFFYTTEYLE